MEGFERSEANYPGDDLRAVSEEFCEAERVEYEALPSKIQERTLVKSIGGAVQYTPVGVFVLFGGK